ncbi:MAG: hypothetical protein IJO11_04635, partial [Alphaproteobacteria bacterium]|nr:hypothetical protein [Alphaproteobacteria bacterium]
EEPEDTPCPTGQERNDKGDCVCKANHYGESCIECLSPRKWDDIYGCICAGVKSVWDSGEQTCVCPANHYGANCVRCMEPREWVNNDCICNGPKSVWNNETQLCECPKNYYTEDCSVYCAGEYASWNGTACVCSFRNSEWSPTERACICKDDYYGTNCDYCAGKYTKWDDGNNRCICTLQNSTWNKDKNVCECLNNYYGTNCDYCAGTHASWNSSTNKCECSLTHSHWTGTACVCDTDYYGPSCVYCAGANSKWDSTNNKCTCTLANSTWNTTQNKCICNTNYYGPSCTYCAGNYTKWDSTNNKCTCTQSTREWNGTACVCKTGYYGDNCTYCAGTNASWDSTNKKCVCSSGSWSASSKKCVTTGSTQDTCYAPKVWSGGNCACPSDTPYYQSGTNKCVKCYQADESKPYWNGLTCTTCPSDEPTWDSTNKQCVACTTAKPYWDTATQTCKTCYEVNNAKPKWNTSTSACEACPTANPYWDGTQCTILSTWCGNQIKNIGLTNYSASGDTVTYNTNMTVSKNLDISDCNLVVKGTLTVNSGITLKAKNVSATSSTSNGINNAGTITVTNKVYGNGYAHGVHNQSTGKLTAGILEGMQSAPIQDSSGNYLSEIIIINDGVMNIDTVISSQGTTWGASFQNNGTLTANHLIGIASGLFTGFINSNIMKIGTIDLKGALYNTKGSLTVTGKARVQTFSHVAGTSSFQDLYASSYSGGGILSNGSGSVSVGRLVATSGYTNYGVTVRAKTIYALYFEQDFWGPGLRYCENHWAGPGTTIVTGSINYCQNPPAGGTGTCTGKGKVTGTYQKKCIPTCSGSTPIWNGESCEGCPSIRPNWNAEYGICE